MEQIRKILGWTLMVLISATALVYAGDMVWARFRLAGDNSQFVETSQIRRLYAIPQKNGKFSFSFGDPETQSCIHSLFPHFDYPPCWYEHREQKKPVFL